MSVFECHSFQSDNVTAKDASQSNHERDPESVCPWSKRRYCVDDGPSFCVTGIVMKRHVSAYVAVAG